MRVNNLKQAVVSETSGVITLNATPITGFNIFPASQDGVEQTYFVFEGFDWMLCRGVYTDSVPSLDITTILQKSVSGTIEELPATSITLTTAAEVVLDSNAFEPYRKPRDLSAAHANTVMYVPDNIVACISLPFLNANRMHLCPAIFYEPVIITNMIMEVTTAVTTSNVRHGIYSCGPGGLPVTLLRETGDVSAGVSTTGTKVNALSSAILLPAGVYWFASVTSSGTLKYLSCLNETDCLHSPIGVDVSGLAIKIYENGVTGVLPTTIGTLTPDTLYKTSMGYS